jgi:hypothetical protein
MKRLVLAIVAATLCASAYAGGRGHNNGSHHGYYGGGHYNGWAVAGAAALGFWGGYAVARPWVAPSYGVWNGPVYGPPPVFFNYPPQQVVVCVQSGDSPFFQQGNCFTQSQQFFPR